MEWKTEDLFQLILKDMGIISSHSFYEPDPDLLDESDCLFNYSDQNQSHQRFCSGCVEVRIQKLVVCHTKASEASLSAQKLVGSIFGVMAHIITTQFLTSPISLA